MSYTLTIEQARQFGDKHNLSLYKLDYIKIGLHRFTNILTMTDEQWEFTTRVCEAAMLLQRHLPVPVSLIGNDELFVKAVAKAKYHKENPFAVAFEEDELLV